MSFSSRGEISADVHLCKFSQPDVQNFVEVYCSVDAFSIAFKKIGGQQYQGSVQVLLVIRKGKSSIKYADKYNLLSPVISDTAAGKRNFTFMDLKRIGIENGEYTLEIQMKDNNNLNDTLSFSKPFTISYKNGSAIEFSDLEFLSSYKVSAQKNIFTKNNLDMIPLPSNTFTDHLDTLYCYFEIYNAPKIIPKNEPFYVITFITQPNSPKVLDKYRQTSKQVSNGGVTPVMSVFDIRDLASNTYLLNVEIYNKTNQVVARTLGKFYRINYKTDSLLAPVAINLNNTYVAQYSESELTDYIKALVYVSTPNEIAMATGLSTLQEKQQYFYTFWYKRASDKMEYISSGQTGVPKEWGDYLNRLKYANKYATKLNPGWKTDRGHVLVQYGLPNDIDAYYNEPSSWPHEIWTYYHLGTASNVIFVFYNPDLVTEEFRLLHSNYRGEFNNPNWRTELYSKTSGLTNPNPDVGDPTRNKPDVFGEDKEPITTPKQQNQ